MAQEDGLGNLDAQPPDLPPLSRQSSLEVRPVYVPGGYRLEVVEVFDENYDPGDELPDGIPTPAPLLRQASSFDVYGNDVVFKEGHHDCEDERDHVKADELRRDIKEFGWSPKGCECVWCESLPDVMLLKRKLKRQRAESALKEAAQDELKTSDEQEEVKEVEQSDVNEDEEEKKDEVKEEEIEEVFPTHLVINKEFSRLKVVELSDAIGEELDEYPADKLINLLDKITISADTMKLWENLAGYGGDKSQIKRPLQTVIDYSERQNPARGTRNKLRYVTKHLTKKDAEFDAAGILVMLSQHGNMCNVQKEVGINMSYSLMTNTLQGELEKQSFKTLMTQLLWKLKIKVIEELFNETHSYMNTHPLLAFQNGIAPYFGLDLVHDEHQAPESPNQEHLTRLFELYNAKHVVLVTSLAINESPRKIPYDAVLQWIQKHTPKGADKYAYLSRVFDEDGKVQDKYIEKFLVEDGVLDSHDTEDGAEAALGLLADLNDKGDVKIIPNIKDEPIWAEDLDVELDVLVELPQLKQNVVQPQIGKKKRGRVRRFFNRIFKKHDLEEAQEEVKPIYDYDVLVRPGCPIGVDKSKKEEYLSEQEFEAKFGVKKAVFKKLRPWKRRTMKKKLQLL